MAHPFTRWTLRVRTGAHRRVDRRAKQIVWVASAVKRMTQRGSAAEAEAGCASVCAATQPASHTAATALATWPRAHTSARTPPLPRERGSLAGAAAVTFNPAR
eukprot:365906-Chlamydomonas_euryale.AAC.14